MHEPGHHFHYEGAGSSAGKILTRVIIIDRKGH